MAIVSFFVEALAQVLQIILSIMGVLIMLRALISWVNPDPYNVIVQFLYKTTEPLLSPFRRLIPAYSIGIDLSPIFALLLILFLQSFLVRYLFYVARVLM